MTLMNLIEVETECVTQGKTQFSLNVKSRIS